MSELDITTNFEASKDYTIVFQVFVKNISGNNISNVEIILNRIDSILNPIGDERQLFNIIEPGKSCTSEFKFQYSEELDNKKIGAYIIYYNQKGKKNIVSILPQKIKISK
jgi:hypothetical protein